MLNRISVVLVGNESEKRNFVQSLNENLGKERLSTIGVDFFLYHHQGQQFQIFDTAGADRFFPVQKTYIHKADAIIFFNTDQAKINQVINEARVGAVIIHQEKDKRPLDYLDAIQKELSTTEDEIEAAVDAIPTVELPHATPVTATKPGLFSLLAKNVKEVFSPLTTKKDVETASTFYKKF